MGWRTNSQEPDRQRPANRGAPHGSPYQYLELGQRRPSPGGLRKFGSALHPPDPLGLVTIVAGLKTSQPAGCTLLWVIRNPISATGGYSSVLYGERSPWFIGSHRGRHLLIQFNLLFARMMLPRNISLNFRLLFLACFLFFCKIGVWGCDVIKLLL